MLIRFRFTWIYLVSAIYFSAAITHATHAQYFDDQFDGSSPVAWLRGNPPVDAGDLEVRDGVYWITPGIIPNNPDQPGFAETDSQVGDYRYETFSMHTRFRAEDAARDDYWIGIFGRSSYDIDEVGSSLFAAISEQGELALATSNNIITDDDYLEFIQTSMRPHQHDIDMRLDVLEDPAMLWAWRSSDAMPVAPTLVLDNLPSYLDDDGRIGVYALNHNSAPTTFGFEFFSVTAVPEPTGGL